MTAVIKSGAAGADIRVRGLAVASPPEMPSAQERRIAELEHRLELAEADLAARDQEIARLSRAADAAQAEGRAQGLVEGRKSADDRSEALHKTLAAAAEASVAAFRDRLAGLEDAVGGLAAIALDRIVAHRSERQALVADTVRRAIAESFAGSVIAVEVSAEDFADIAPLRAMAPPDCEMRLLKDLPSGGCRLRLRMGEVDLGLQGQVARLSAILDPIS